MKLMRRTTAVVAWLEGQLGDYPFSITGGVVTGLPAGVRAREPDPTDLPAVSGNDTWLLVHELAHQWFGDSVSVQTGRDIWLNEGFATFMEVWYTQTHGGQSARSWMCTLHSHTGAGDQFWDLEIGDPARGTSSTAPSTSAAR